MKKRIAGFLALMVVLSVCASSLAEGDTFTLPELRAQAPERLQMTVSTATGTVTVDAPVILPKAEALPVLLCRSQRFRFEDDDQYHVLYAEKASEKHLIYGRTDATGRYVLPMGETPPENDFTLEKALDLILRLNAEAGGDSGVDLRLNRVAAMSGLCKMKSVKTTDESTGVSVRTMAADPAQPVKGKEKGIWLIELAQYLRGVRVIDDSGHRYRADGYFSPWVTKNESRVMDENNYHVLVGYLREVGTLADDSPLAGWDAVENSIRTLIAQGRLKSVYQVELVYLVKTFQEDNDAIQRGKWTKDVFSCDYALVPVWEIKGWNLYEANEGYFATGTSPDREAILMNSLGEPFQTEDYVLRLNADTAAPFEPADKLYYGEIPAA